MNKEESEDVDALVRGALALLRNAEKSMLESHKDDNSSECCDVHAAIALLEAAEERL